MDGNEAVEQQRKSRMLFLYSNAKQEEWATHEIRQLAGGASTYYCDNRRYNEW
jgi:hypothetical protein